jgi:hypothetical protein
VAGASRFGAAARLIWLRWRATGVRKRKQGSWVGRRERGTGSGGYPDSRSTTQFLSGGPEPGTDAENYMTTSRGKCLQRTDSSPRLKL